MGPVERLSSQLRPRPGWPPSRRLALAGGAAACAGGMLLVAAAAASGRGSASTAAAGVPAPGSPQFRVVPVAGDGNCLFNSLAQGEALSAGHAPLSSGAVAARAPALRAWAVKELKMRRDDIEWAIEGDFDQYVSKMSRDGTWGGEIELLMMSHHLKCPIEVYMKNPALRRIQVYGEEHASRPAMYVLFHGLGHYEALWKQGGGAAPTSKL